MAEINKPAFTLSRDIPCAVLSFLSVFSLTNMLKEELPAHSLSNSVFSLMLFAAVYFLLRKTVTVLNKRLAVTSVITGFILSTLLAWGSNIIKYDMSMLNSFKTCMSIIFATPVSASLVAMIFRYSPMLNAYMKPKKMPGIFNKIESLSNRKTFFICLALIFIAWLPGFIASYPGIYAYDCVFQMQFFLDDQTSLHHPLISTYLLGFFVWVLGNLFKSREIGMCLYSLTQMLCLASSFAAVCAWMKRQKVSVFIRLLCLAVIMFLPLNAIMSFSGTKDVLFSAAFLMLSLYLVEILRDKNWIYNNLNILKLILASFFFVAFRNQAFYVFIVVAVISIILLRRHWKRVLTWLLVFTALFMLYKGPITKLANGVDTSSVNEMMSVPCMQLSRAMLNNSDELTENQKDLIEEYIPEYQRYQFDPGISDVMKGSFNSARFTENPKEFLKLWLDVGIKCPITYIDAFLRLTIGLWYPDMNYRDAGAFHPYWAYISTQQNSDNSWVIVDRQTPKSMQWLSDFYYSLTYDNSYQDVPVISMLFSSGFICWCVLLFLVWCIYFKKYKYLLFAFLMILLWCTLLLGPVVLFRYVYPLAVVLPLVFGIVLTEPNRERVLQED